MARGARRMNSISRVQPCVTEAQWNKFKGRKNLVFVHFATKGTRTKRGPFRKHLDAFEMATIGRQGVSRTQAEITKFINSLSKAPEYRKVTFVKFDMDKLGAVAAKLGVLSSPSFQCYRNNELLESFAGLIPAKMIAMLDTHNKAGKSGSKLPFSGPLMALVLAALAGVGFLKYQKDQKSKTTTTVLAGATTVEAATAAAAAAVVKVAEEKEEDKDETDDEADEEDDESEEEEEDDDDDDDDE